MAGEFSKLVAEQEVGRVTCGILRTIERSFADDGSRKTQSEVARRFQICEKIFRLLRGDKGWGIQRVLGKLPEYLRCELDGKPWVPDERTIWAAGDD